MAVISPVGVPSHVCAAAYALIAPLDGSVFVGWPGFVDLPEFVGWLGFGSAGWSEVVSELSLVGCCCIDVVVSVACACFIGAVASPRHKAAMQVVATAATQ